MHRSFLRPFPLCIWLLFAISLWCLISALAQAGGGDLLFRFTSSVQSSCGEGGALQTDITVCGEHSPCSGHTGFAPYRGVCAFPVYTAQAPCRSIWSRPCVECGSSFQVLHKSAAHLFPPRPQRAPLAACVCSELARSWPLAATLPVADVNHPESQEVFR